MQLCRTSRRLGAASVLLAAATAVGLRSPAAPAVGPTADLTWNTVDGGGVMRSTGGDFELSGTIGQLDAGVLSGGNFHLTGGFWFEVIRSDCNEDGVVNLFDFDTFQLCLAGPGGGPPAPGCNCYDFDGDGTIALADFATVQAMFNGH